MPAHLRSRLKSGTQAEAVLGHKIKQIAMPCIPRVHWRAKFTAARAASHQRLLLLHEEETHNGPLLKLIMAYVC